MLAASVTETRWCGHACMLSVNRDFILTRHGSAVACVRQPPRPSPSLPPSHPPPAHSPYGTDESVKLPNLTDEEVDRQGLEDLYSINESAYQCRPHFSPGPDSWDDFQKDVDNMFALRHILNHFNQTRKLDDDDHDDHDTAAPDREVGSGAGGGDLGEGSGGEGTTALARDAWLGEVSLATPPAPSMPPPPPPPPPPPR